MANRRMINKSISVSEQVNELNDFSALLFTWLIPHTDDYGIIPGSSKKIKALVMPMRKQSADQIENALKEIQSAGLIWRFVYKDNEYLQFCKFEEHQEGLHKRTTAKNPLYYEVFGDSENFREIPGNSRLIEPKGKEEKLNKYEPLFELFWSEYPEPGYQKSKPQALKNFTSLIKNKKVNADDLIQAAKNYAADCKAEGKTTYLYKASNFVGRDEYYKSYLPENWIPAKPKQISNKQDAQKPSDSLPIL